VLLAVFELTDVNAAVLPLILPRTFGLALEVCPREHVAVRKDVSALTMLETITPLSFVSIAVLPLMNTIAVSFALLPLTNVRVAQNTLPNSLAVLQSRNPLAFVHLAISPGVDSLPMRFVVLEISLVPVPVGVAFHSFSVASILVPVSLVDTRLAVDHHAHALPAVVGQLPSVDGVVVPLDAEGRLLRDCIIIKDVTLHKIVIIDTHCLPLLFINKYQVPLDLLDSLLLG
jgi:hypothetical protein